MADDRERVARLYDLHGPVIYRRCLKLLRDEGAAEAATQEIFGKLLANRARLRDAIKALPFLYREATAHCLAARVKIARRGAEPLEDLDVIAEAGLGYPERILEQHVLSRFEPDTQAVAVGVLVDGMEQGELARALGVPLQPLKDKLAQFIASVRKFVIRSAP